MKNIAILSSQLLILLFSNLSYCQLITTVAGNGTYAYSGDGGGATLASTGPNWITTDAAGVLYISDNAGHSIRTVNAAGIINTIAGSGSAGYSGDGGQATAATLNHPGGVDFDAAGNMYIADRLNHCIRKVDVSGLITTVAGTGVSGYMGDGGLATAAQMKDPVDVAVDRWGNIFFTDDVAHTIREINSLGIITTIAGNGTYGFSGDGGPASAALLNEPSGVAVDTAGNIYIGDYLNHRVRMINAGGTITTVAGSGSTGVGGGGYGGDWGPATSALLRRPAGIKVDLKGNIYIADALNQRVRKVNTLGIITTVAGTGTSGYSGDDSLATAAKLNGPGDVALNCSGDLFIADVTNARVRKVWFNHNPLFGAGVNQSTVACKNTSRSLDSLLTTDDADTGQQLTWSVASAPLHGTVSGSFIATSTGSSITPTGIFYTPVTGYTGSDSFSVKVSDCSNVPGITTIHVAVNNCPLGLSTMESAKTSVFPNPAGDELNISSGGGYHTLTVSSVVGTVMIVQQVNMPQEKLNVQQLPPGVYYVTLTGESGKVVTKFVKR